MLAVYACLVLVLYSLTGCSTPTGMTTSLNPAAGSTPQFASPDGLSADETATLSSLKSVDNYPLYTMTYFGDEGIGWNISDIPANPLCNQLQYRNFSSKYFQPVAHHRGEVPALSDLFDWLV